MYHSLHFFESTWSKGSIWSIWSTESTGSTIASSWTLALVRSTGSNKALMVFKGFWGGPAASSGVSGASKSCVLGVGVGRKKVIYYSCQFDLKSHWVRSITFITGFMKRKNSSNAMRLLVTTSDFRSLPFSIQRNTERRAAGEDRAGKRRLATILPRIVGSTI